MHPPETNTLLLVLALLLLFLLVAMRTRKEGGPRPRHTPLSPDELGRYVYTAAQSRDAEAWRDLFLLGGEAGKVLGPRASDYLSRMTPERRMRGLASVISALPPHAVYQATEVEASGVCRMRVRRQDGVLTDIPVGRVVKVGAAWRIQEVVDAPG